MKPTTNTLVLPVINILNNTAGRWGACTLAVLIWFYTLTIAAGAVAGVALMMISVYVLYVVALAYSRMLEQRNRSHGHVWLKIAFYLTATGWLCIAMPVTGIVLTFVLTFVLQCAYGPNNGDKMAREGTFIEQDSRRIAVEMAKLAPANDQGFLLGGVYIPSKSATKHTLFIGTTGSGKSVSMKLIAKDVLPAIGQTHDRRAQGQHVPNKRALLYDPATEWPAILKAMGIPGRAIIYTNPFRTDVRPWALCRDIRTTTQAIALAEILAPVPKNCNDPFWIECTQIFLTAVVRYFIEVARDRWTLRDLLLAARDMDMIIKMMEDDEKLHHYAQVRGSEKTADNIRSTVINIVSKYEVIAALWHKAETVYGNKPFSIKEDFVGASAILVLSRSTTADKQLREINRIIFTRVVQLLMEQPEAKETVTHFFLDELGSLNKLEALLTAATELRKRGVAIIAGFQALSHVIENFNQHLAQAIVSQFNHIAALRTVDYVTEEWLCKTWGKVRFERNTFSKSGNWNQGTTRTVTQTFGEEDVLRPGSLSDIPEFDPSAGTGLSGYYRSGHRKWHHTYPASIVQELPPEGDPRDNMSTMPEEYQEIDPWKYADYQRLNIEHLYEGALDAIPTDALPGASTPPTLEPRENAGVLASAGASLDVDTLRGMAADAEGLSAAEYLEKQFQQFEQQYGINFDDPTDDPTGATDDTITDDLK